MRIEEKNFINFLKKYYKSFPLSFVDVGGNTGKYSRYVQANLNIDKGYIFEPIKSCFEKLHLGESFTKYNIGLGNKTGDILFYEAKGKESHSSIINRKWLFSKPEYKIDEKVIKIDKLENIIFHHLNFLKIDAEGYELEILKGSQSLLEDKKIDFIQFEYGGCFKDNNIKLNDVIDFMKKFNYSIYTLNEDGFSLIDHYKDDYKWVNLYSTYKNILK